MLEGVEGGGVVLHSGCVVVVLHRGRDVRVESAAGECAAGEEKEEVKLCVSQGVMGCEQIKRVLWLGGVEVENSVGCTNRNIFPGRDRERILCFC